MINSLKQDYYTKYADYNTKIGYRQALLTLRFNSLCQLFCYRCRNLAMPNFGRSLIFDNTKAIPLETLDKRIELLLSSSGPTERSEPHNFPVIDMAALKYVQDMVHGWEHPVLIRRHSDYQAR